CLVWLCVILLLLLPLPSRYPFPKRVIHQYLSDKCLLFFRGRSHFGSYRKSQAESDTLTLLVLDVDFPAMMIDDEITGHEIDAEFVMVTYAQRKGIEYRTQRFPRQPGAIIPEFNFHFLLCFGAQAC